MRRQLYLWSIIICCGLLAACQPKSDVLPTLIDLNANATNDAATAMVKAASANATLASDSATQTAVAVAHLPPTLPPTWTPSPEAAQPTPENAGVHPSETPVGASGTIYFVFNGDSIAALKADASDERLILVGGAPADLTLSPDGKFLAYSAKGNGSAREIFITNLDGSYVQQVSCLGFSRVTAPGWSPDSQTLVFGGSQSLNGPLGLYAAGIVGSGQCPSGNNQRLLVQTSFNGMTSVTWNDAGTRVFFASDGVYAFDMSANLLYPPLTSPSGYGPDRNPAYRPGTDELYYLRSFFDGATNLLGGTLYHFSTSDLSTLPIDAIPGPQFGAQLIHWSPDGRYLVVSTSRDVILYDVIVGSNLPIVTGSNFFPQAIFSPDGETVAYVDGKFGARTIPEIYVISKDGQSQRQITQHQEGTIANLNWGE